MDICGESNLIKIPQQTGMYTFAKPMLTLSANTVWERLLLHMIGENFDVNTGDHITGLSAEVRTSGVVLALWSTAKDDTSTKKLRAEIESVINGDYAPTIFSKVID